MLVQQERGRRSWPQLFHVLPASEQYSTSAATKFGDVITNDQPAIFSQADDGDVILLKELSESYLSRLSNLFLGWRWIDVMRVDLRLRWPRPELEMYGGL